MRITRNDVMAHSHSHADSPAEKIIMLVACFSPLSHCPDLCSLRWWAGYSPALWRCWRMGLYAHRRGGPYFALLAVPISVVPDVRHTFGWLDSPLWHGLCEMPMRWWSLPSHCLGSDRAFYTPRPVAGSLMMVIAVCGLLANLFAFKFIIREA